MFPGLGVSSEDREDPNYLDWRRRRVIFKTEMIVVMVIPILPFILAGVPLRAAAIQGFLVADMITVVANSFAEIMIPWRHEQWRAWMMEGSPASYQKVGKAFDGVLLPGDQRQSEHQYRKLRLFGLGLFALNALFVGIILWICSIGGWI